LIKKHEVIVVELNNFAGLITVCSGVGTHRDF